MRLVSFLVMAGLFMLLGCGESPGKEKATPAPPASPPAALATAPVAIATLPLASPTPFVFEPEVVEVLAPTPLPSPTPTRVPPTPQPAVPTPTPIPTETPLPTATPTPTFPFVLDGIRWLPNCGLTAIFGNIRNASGQGIPNQRAKVGSAIGDWSAVSAPTDAEGYYEFALRQQAFANRWYLFVVGEGGAQLSERVDVETDASDCRPGGQGRQVYFVNFKRVN